MSSQVETYYCTRHDGALIRVTENDGWACVRNGPERKEEIIYPNHPKYEEYLCHATRITIR